MKIKTISISTAMFMFALLSGTVIAGDSKPTHADVAYGPHHRNRLDFWQAKGEGPRPLVVEIHGGGWTGGKRSSKPRWLGFCLGNGFSMATINYRLTKHAKLPAPVHDAARAIQFLRSKAKEWNIDKERIALIGGSAGACTSMWLLFHDDLADPKAEDPILRESTRVCAAAVTNGQTSIDPKVIEKWVGPIVLKHGMIRSCASGMPTVGRMMNRYDLDKALYHEFSPINHLDKDDPPLLMSYGSDLTVPAKNMGHAIHHGMFGVKLKEKADEIGHETHLGGIKGRPCKYKWLGPFLVEKLKSDKK